MIWLAVVAAGAGVESVRQLNTCVTVTPFFARLAGATMGSSSATASSA